MHQNTWGASPDCPTIDSAGRWAGTIPASPPAEPDPPKPPVPPPRTPEFPPDKEPPAIDDPPPDVVPVPVREPPSMPRPGAQWLTGEGAGQPTGKVAGAGRRRRPAGGRAQRRGKAMDWHTAC